MKAAFATRAVHILIIVAASVSMALSVWMRASTILDPDSASYLRPAENLAAGRGFTSEGRTVSFAESLPGYPNIAGAEVMRTPLYPALIAAFLACGAGLKGLILFQHLLNAAVAVGLYLFLTGGGSLAALRPFGASPAQDDKRARAIALAAALLYALYLPAAQVANEVIAETVSTALVLTAVIAAERAIARDSAVLAAVSGMTLGLSVLARPISLYFFIPLTIVVLAFARRRAVLALVLVVCSQLAPGAWSVRNWRVTGVATVTTISAENLLFQWAAAAHVTRNQPHWFRLTAAQQQLGFRSALHRARTPLFHQAMAIARADGVDPMRLNAAQKAEYFQRLAIHLLRQRPVAVAELMVSGVMELLLFAPATSFAETRFGALLPRSFALFVTLAAVALALAVAGLIAIARINKPLAALMFVTVAYFTLTAAIPEATVRYTLVFAPWYAALIAGAFLRASAVKPGQAVSR